MNNEERRFVKWGKIMMLTIALGSFLILATLFVFCFRSHEYDRNELLEFKTVASSLSTAIEIVKVVHGPIKASGQDLDIDGDNMNDYYIVTETEIVFATSFRRLIQGQDTAEEHTWRRIPIEQFKNARPGEYPTR
ncbi:MAG: hypothetical protein U9M90_04250 [Patescibacteria group bacterium]|nr:hypothetical protein [Patescibacteria group bacterium]